MLMPIFLRKTLVQLFFKETQQEFFKQRFKMNGKSPTKTALLHLKRMPEIPCNRVILMALLRRPFPAPTVAIVLSKSMPRLVSLL